MDMTEVWGISYDLDDIDDQNKLLKANRSMPGFLEYFPYASHKLTPKKETHADRVRKGLPKSPEGDGISR